MAIAPNVVPVELVITPLVTDGVGAQDTTEWEGYQSIIIGNISHLLLQVRDDPVHCILV